MTTVGRSVLGKILLLACILCVCLEGGCGLRSRELLRRLEQLEKEKGWRILASSGDLYLLDVQTNSLITIYKEVHDPWNVHLSPGSFSPDGKSIVLIHGDALVVLDLVQRKEEVLLRMPHLEGARWSPAGEGIAFEGGPDSKGLNNLYFIRLRDRTVSLIVEGGTGSQFSWRPDGKGIVYEDHQQSLWMLDLVTKQRQRLDNGRFPSWSPDGRYIAYVTEPGRIIYDVTTGRKDTIISGEMFWGDLVWSPDSRYVAYSRPRFLFLAKSSGSLWVMDLHSKTHALLYSQGRGIHPADWVAGVPVSIGN